jgi:hypothetical protein
MIASGSDDLRRLLLSARAHARAAVSSAKAPLPNVSTSFATALLSEARAGKQHLEHKMASLPVISSTALPSSLSRRGKTKDTRKKKTTAATEHSSDCPICLQPMLDSAKTSCGHSFCFMCLFHPDVTACPMCRAPVSVEAGDFELDHWADLCAKIFHEREVQDRRAAIARFTAKFGSASDILSACKAAMAAQTPPGRDSDGRLLAEVQFRITVARQHSTKSMDDVVAAQQMTFSNGFMRRRAPSIVVISDGERMPPSFVQMSPRVRNGASGVIVPRRDKSPRAHTALPYTVEIDADADEGISMPAAQPPKPQAETDDDGDPFGTPRLLRQGVLAPRLANQSLPRLPSADTRLNQEMRILIKHQSVAAATRRRQL